MAVTSHLATYPTAVSTIRITSWQLGNPKLGTHIVSLNRIKFPLQQ